MTAQLAEAQAKEAPVEVLAAEEPAEIVEEPTAPVAPTEPTAPAAPVAPTEPTNPGEFAETEPSQPTVAEDATEEEIAAALAQYEAEMTAYEAAKGDAKVGTTGKGIGPTYTDKVSRNGLRVGDIICNFEEKYAKAKARHEDILKSMNFEYDITELEKEWLEAINYLKDFHLVDSEHEINGLLKAGKSVLCEGAQGTLLDVDFGSYPFVTSSNTICAGACTGLGIGPNKIGNVYGIMKAYCTRVGSGPFPTELFDETGKTIRDLGHEYGAVTGRERRCGWIDLVALKYAIMVNGVTHLIMMKSDVLDGFETIKACTAYRINGQQTRQFPFDVVDGELEPVYEELKGWKTDMTSMKSPEQFPAEFNAYIDFLERELNVPICIVSVGPDRSQTIIRGEI